jgi:enoyl reductase-like protein
MALPKQVENDLKDIEELERKLTARAAPVEEDGLGEEAEAETVAEKPEPKVEVETTPVEPVVEVQDDFKQKYSTLRGKYDAEVPRLHSQVKDLTQQIADMKELFESQQKAEEPKPTSFVTDADVEEFGQDLIDVQRRVAQEVSQSYEGKIAAMEKIIEDLKGRVDQTGRNVGEMTFEQKLLRLVPDFDQVNTDERWVTWLDEFDPMVRGPRRTLAQQAFESGDAEGVAHYVRLFRELNAPGQKVEDRKNELEKQVTPTRSQSKQTLNSDSSKRVYSKAEANQVWDKIQDLSSVQRYDEANKLEAEISAAYVEGRVRS